MKSGFIFISILFSFLSAASQSTGIGTLTPDPSTILDIQSNNKGLLIPRLALVSANSVAPVSNPADALLIYNTATAGSYGNAVTPGFYFWNAPQQKWISINSEPDENDSGYGVWPCTMPNIREYNPVAAADGATNDLFGHTVSISGNFAIIGARGDNSFQGAAYAFMFNGTAWIQQQKLTASDGTTSDYFGTSVSISGNTAIVGAFGDNMNRGAAYIFQYNGSAWTEQQKLTASDAMIADFFGVSVDIDNQFAVIGAPGDNSLRGSAYIFHYNGTVWSQQTMITTPSGLSGDQFGVSAAIQGNTILIGAPTDQVNGQIGQGSVHVFTGTSWNFITILLSSDGAASDAFGHNVDLSDDQAIVGAPGKNSSTGAAYIYILNGAVWTQAQILLAPAGQAQDNFGFRVAMNDEYACVGSYLDDIETEPVQLNQGSAVIFQNISGVWLTLEHVVNPSGIAQDNFGSGCAIDDNNFLIGASKTALSRGMAVFGKIK